MKMLNEDIRKLTEFVKKIEGMKAWGFKVGYGSFLTIEFGKPVKDNNSSDEYIHGEYHLWIYFSAWRIEKNGTFLVGCEDSREKMIDAVQSIRECKLKSFEIISSALDVNLKFDNGITIRLFSIASGDDEDDQHWFLYMPGRKVLLAGPGNKWSIEDESV